jgi:glycerol-3-phosphate acyltransferase PlsY
MACGAISLMLVWRHKSNIKNLFAGTEPRLGAKRA